MRARPAAADSLVRLRGLSVRLGLIEALSQVDFEVGPGELVALVGANGAGKTTLLRVLLGELRPADGTVERRATGRGRDGGLRTGYVPQRLDFDRAAPVAVADLFDAVDGRWPVFLPRGRDRRALVQASLAATGVADLAERRLGDLSGGETQRVLLALALHPEPDLLLLDEPAAHLDAAAADAFHAQLARLRDERGLGIVLVSHDLGAAAPVADRLVVLDRVVVADGSPAEVLARLDVRRRLGLDLPLPRAAKEGA